jgi:Uncharacterized NAD(FAD)-dependent dehydrogenases
MKVIIIGGVAGGAGTAARLRRNCESADIILIEKDEFISYANCGLPYYIGGVITDEAALQLQTPESFNRRFNVDVRVKQEVLSVDTEGKCVKVIDYKTSSIYTENYDALVISPGAVPVIPKIPGVENKHVFTLRNIPDMKKMKGYIDLNKPETAVIVGGGFIGLEMADNLYQLGISVTIVEAQSHVIAALDADMAYDVHNHIRSKGVKLVLEDSVVDIGESSVRLKSGSCIPADLVLMSVGVRPNTAFLQNSGIELGERGGIVVDNEMRTNIDNIFALGDAAYVKDFITGKDVLVPLASPANKQARIVADNICGGNSKYRGTQGTAIAKVFDMTIAITGENTSSLKAASVKYLKTFTYSGSNAGYYPGSTFMFVKLLFDAKEGKLLGAQITGKSGVDKRIDVLASAIRAGMTVSQLTELELSYAPPFSSAKDPVNMAGYAAENLLNGKVENFYVEDIAGIKDGILLDCRTQREFGLGTIEGAINIPLDSLRENLHKLDKNKTIYNFCQIGLRGYIGNRILVQNGFHALNLAGGYRHYSAFMKDKNAIAKN